MTGHVRTRCRPAGERGQATIEFVFVLPLLLILVFGVIDFGRALNYWNDLNQIAGEGARMAAVNRNPSTLKSELLAQGDTDELRKTMSVKLCLPEGAKVGAPVVVKTEAVFDWLPAITNLVGVADTTTLKASATMRLEAAPTFTPDAC